MLSSDRADFTAWEVVRHREEYLLLLFICQVMSCRLHGLQHARLLCPLLSPGVCSNSFPLSQWCNPLILCCPLLLLFSVFPSIRVFSRLFASSGQSIGASASASVLPVNIQGWFPLGLTGWISLLSKGLSRDFFTPQFESISSLVLSLLFGPTLTSVHDYWKNHSFYYINLHSKVMSFLFNTLSSFVIAFFPRSKQHLILWLLLLSAMILEPNKINSVTVSIFSPVCLPWSHGMGLDAMILVIWMLSLKRDFSLSSFTFIKRLFSSSLLSAIRVVSSAYLRLLIFLLAVLVSAWALASLAFHMMYSAYKLNK